ncbi:DNA polymerase I [Bifidobacterium psychraerophilum]|jgi:DNA polymerase-1|uniref:DNA polymerase I n=1 Tax=Bifidobacterium psychraerophilum TaxID=218140 RepID=UPI0023F3D2CF|nr:DNA polymerase I [Bifidobacterium psychraerophilum]MCI1660414.1 DNA polymerase I [Bifidobacterium psychraerophilum]MCI1805015.1 DNA polymerase I [Bifidobacterium psychraerophilum]MCI2177419.1 DNA polymerase I [Bifidobacterium psychraerophilum]MCI2182724.1 DNA polymerase I [Bifidobacterium psychraerophilum]
MTSQEQKDDNTLLVVDGHSLAFRAFFALPVESFSNDAGQSTNAVWGFSTMLAQVIESEHPTHLAVAFDVKGGTFRNEMLPQYKGTRDAAPEELLSQLPLIQDLLRSLGVTYIEKPGFEGDDVIGTLATMGEQAGFRTLVLSGDRDAFQLVDERITVLYPGHHFKELKHMTPDAIVEKYHVTPVQYPDLAAMRGETADNIPGVPGVGDGFAAKWINEYGGLEGILEHADSIGGKKGQALRENIDQVRLNRKVNALVRDLDLGVEVGDLTFGDVDTDAAKELFAKLQFGERTRNRVLKAFNCMPVADAAQESTPDAEEEPDAVLDTVSTKDELMRWAHEHLVTVSGGREDPATTGAEEHGEQGDQQSGHCADDVAQSWILSAEGDDRPGRASCASLTFMSADGHAVILEASAFSQDDDDSLHEGVAAVLDTYASQAAVHGYKEHSHMLASAHLPLPQPVLDTKLAGYLVHPDFHPDSVERAAEHFLQIESPAESKSSSTQGAFAFDDETAEGNDEERRQHEELLLRRAGLVYKLARYLAPVIDERRQLKLLTDIEMPVSSTLSRMESYGAAIDGERLVNMRDQFAADARQAQELAWEKAGTKVNLQSPKQLQQVLFEDMGLRHSRKTKSGSYTTNAAALQDMYLKSVDNERANTFLGALLRHRETNKLKQIVQTLLDAVNPRDGRIHTTFEQTVAATGRLSSVDPNLQNIPNRNAQGREIRSAFVPGPGFISLLSSDYSQVELRIMADLSGDEALIEAFRSGRDFHKYVASLVYDLPVDDITQDQRSHVKAMSYGLAYGLSTYGLAQQLRISPAAADVLKEKYFATFGKVRDYLESLVDTAREKGYTETMFGRRRYFPGLKSTNRQARDAAERGALNAPIQGSAADIMKIAMVKADQELIKAGLRSRIILQIHDELVVEIADGEQEQATRLVKDAMEHAVEIAVPLDVSTGLGDDWQLAAH